MTDRPRMRTAPQAIAELKKIDPDTAFTLRALRRMMNNGEIIYDIQGEDKKNLHVSDLLELFSKASNGEFANDRMMLS